MNNDTYTPCTKCGRPMAYCKGQCCGKPQGCNCKEYGCSVCGAIRREQPETPCAAVIPSITVDNNSNLTDLCDTFVHVSNINTTFYIDDKHRPIITWAGPVEYDNYDLETNSLGLHGQFLVDFANQLGAYYDKTGNYQVFNFGQNGGTSTERIHIYLPEDMDECDANTEGYIQFRCGLSFEHPSVIVKDDDGNVIAPLDFMGMLDRLGDSTMIVHVPGYTHLPQFEGYVNIDPADYYYKTVLAGDNVTIKGTWTQNSDATFVIVGGMSGVQAILGAYEDELYPNGFYDALISIPA